MILQSFSDVRSVYDVALSFPDRKLSMVLSSSLHLAAAVGSVDAVSAALQQGVDVNAVVVSRRV